MINPDGSLDCVLYLQSQREGSNAPAPEREQAVSYLSGLTDWTEPASAEELVVIQQYFFPHGSRRFLKYVATDLMLSVAQARDAILEGLAADYKGGVMVRMAPEAAEQAGRWVAVLAMEGGQVRYFDPVSPEDVRSEAEDAFLSRLALAASELDVAGPRFVVAQAQPPDAGAGSLEENTAIGYVAGPSGEVPIVVSRARGVYPARDIAKVRANQVAVTGYEDAAIIKEGLAYAVYALREIRMGGSLNLKENARLVHDKVTDLVYSSPHDKNRTLHVAF